MNASPGTQALQTDASCRTDDSSRTDVRYRTDVLPMETARPWRYTKDAAPTEVRTKATDVRAQKLEHRCQSTDARTQMLLHRRLTSHRC